ncbi:MAG TPA: LysR substrate-binding domain-containing protein [Miltoncostaeaceae bacterium]|jgi:DNA-binding transcriptional LysR family regulator|nr:LysR substrate-binding domain-containing protein [Miltoncostaeaceae bacterium]
MAEFRAFVAVADALHFTKAARMLGIAPPSLSQTVRRLEDKLGAVLFVRTPRTVALTAAGAELLPRARDILVRVDDAQNAVNAGVLADTGRLVVGISSNGFAEMTAPILQAYRRAHPGVRVELRDVTEQPDALTSGAIDVALVRPPVPAEGDERVRFEEVVDEPRVAFLPAGHRLAGEEAVSVHDLRDEAWVEVGPGLGHITDFWAATDALGGLRPRMGDGAFSVAGVLQAVAYLENVITSIPSVLRFFHVPGIAMVPLADVAPATMAVMTRADDARPVVADLVAAVHAVAARAPDAVPGARYLPEVVPA